MFKSKALTASVDGTEVACKKDYCDTQRKGRVHGAPEGINFQILEPQRRDLHVIISMPVPNNGTTNKYLGMFALGGS